MQKYSLWYIFKIEQRKVSLKFGWDENFYVDHKLHVEWDDLMTHTHSVIRPHQRFLCSGMSKCGEKVVTIHTSGSPINHVILYIEILKNRNGQHIGKVRKMLSL